LNMLLYDGNAASRLLTNMFLLTSIIILALIHLFSCVIIFLNKDQVRQHLVSTIGLDG